MLSRYNTDCEIFDGSRKVSVCVNNEKNSKKKIILISNTRQIFCATEAQTGVLKYTFTNSSVICDFSPRI